MYKDKDKRRDKDRDRQRRYRASKGVTGVTEPKGVTNEALTSNVRPELKAINSKAPPAEQPKPDIVDVLHARVLANPKVKFKPKPHVKEKEAG